MGAMRQVSLGSRASGRAGTTLRRTVTWVLCFSVLGTLAADEVAATTSARPLNLMFYARGTEPQTTTTAGEALGGGDRQVMGDYLIDTYELYAGTLAEHAKSWTSTVSLHCQITSLSKPNMGTMCEAVLAEGGSMLVAFAPELLQSGANHSYSAPIVFGTGIWVGARGELRADDIGASNNAEFTVQLSPR